MDRSGSIPIRPGVRSVVAFGQAGACGHSAGNGSEAATAADSGSAERSLSAISGPCAPNIQWELPPPLWLRIRSTGAVSVTKAMMRMSAPQARYVQGRTAGGRSNAAGAPGPRDPGRRCAPRHQARSRCWAGRGSGGSHFADVIGLDQAAAGEPQAHAGAGPRLCRHRHRLSRSLHPTLFDYALQLSLPSALGALGLAVTTCCLAALYPALVAQRLSSAESLHYE